LRLDTDARKLLRAGSILGETFWSGALGTLVDRTAPGELASILDDLVDKEVIVRRPRCRFPGDQEFAFRHALIRDAAYAMVTEADRVAGHRVAGTWLETHGERDAVVLAQHFDRGQDRDRARVWHRRAAEQSFDGNDLASATTHAARAID